MANPKNRKALVISIVILVILAVLIGGLFTARYVSAPKKKGIFIRKSAKIGKISVIHPNSAKCDDFYKTKGRALYDQYNLSSYGISKGKYIWDDYCIVELKGKNQTKLEQAAKELEESWKASE